MLVKQAAIVLNHPVRQHFLNLINASLFGIKLHILTCKSGWVVRERGWSVPRFALKLRFFLISSCS